MHLDARRFLKTFASPLDLKAFVFYLKLVEGTNGFINCSVVLILKEGVTFVDTNLRVVLDQVERLKFSKTLAELPNFIFLHLEWNASHEDSTVFSWGLLISTCLDHVLKVLLLSSYSQCFGSWVPAPAHFIIPKNDESLASLNFHGHLLQARVLGPIQIKTDVCVFSLSEFQGQKAHFLVSLLLNAENRVLCIGF